MFILYFVFSSLLYNQTHITCYNHHMKVGFKSTWTGFSRRLLPYLAFQLLQLCSLGLQKALGLFKDLQVVILIAFRSLNVFLQFLQPTKHAVLEQIQRETQPQEPFSSTSPSKPYRGRSTYSSVSFSFFLFRQWKSEFFVAITLFISFKISSCSILCCSNSVVSAWSNLKHILLFPQDPQT